ncbi:MAG TPA: hypothetical protein VE135_15455 [Pyrinomonadaceae bacterium]|nr:hypothetical protein [Pyrinomonadaceae bacterium]
MKTKPWLLLPLIALLLFVNGASVANDQAQLTAQEQKVIDYLVKDWGEDYNVTSVDIAMNAVKVEASDEARFRIGSYIKDHPELHEVIRRWGWVTLVLTPHEKLIARALINAEREGKPAPSLSELASAVGIKEPDVKRGLAMLERYEILKKNTSANGGYRVMPRYIKWEPRLDFVFHKVSLDSGRQFNTN